MWLFALSYEVEYILIKNSVFLYNAYEGMHVDVSGLKMAFVVILLMCGVKFDYKPYTEGVCLNFKSTEVLKM